MPTRPRRHKSRQAALPSGRSSHRAASQPPIHKFDSPKSMASLVKPKSKTSKKKKKKQLSSSKKKKHVEDSDDEFAMHGYKRLPNGLYEFIADDEVRICDEKAVRAILKGSKSKSDEPDSNSSSELVKVKPSDKIRWAFDLDELQTKIDAHIEEMTRMNSMTQLDGALREAEKRLKQLEEQQKQYQQNGTTPYDDNATGNDRVRDSSTSSSSSRVTHDDDHPNQSQSQSQSTCSSSSSSSSTSSSSTLAPTSRGRIRRPPSEAGAPLANYWGGTTTTTTTTTASKKRANHWNTEEYRRKNRLMFQGSDKLHGPSYLVDSSITSSDIDPIQPDRTANEIFQINPLWRVEWKDPFQRLRLKLETIPTTAFDQFKSFELPYQQFGDDMQEIQKKDVPPKFVQIEAS